MAVAASAYHRAQIRTEARYLRPATLPEGHAYAVCAHGDYDPGFVFEDLTIENHGAEDLYVARVGSEALAGIERNVVPAKSGDIIGRLKIAGEVDGFVVHNAQGSGGSSQWQAQYALTAKQNSGGEVGHPGAGEFVVRATPPVNDTRTITLTARERITVTYFETWTKVPASGAACALSAAVPSGNLLSATNINVAGLTTVLLQSHPLTATVARRDLDPGQSITLTLVGAIGLTPGDLLVMIGTVRR